MALRARMAQNALYHMVRGAFRPEDFSLRIVFVKSAYDPLESYNDRGAVASWSTSTSYNVGDVVNFVFAGGPGTEHYYYATVDNGYSSQGSIDMSGQWATTRGVDITETNPPGGQTAQVWRYLGPQERLPVLFNGPVTGDHISNSYKTQADLGIVRAFGSTAIWQPTQTYYRGDCVVPTVQNGRAYLYGPNSNGTSALSGASEPTWPTAFGGTVMDGDTVDDIEWVCLGYNPGAYNAFDQGIYPGDDVGNIVTQGSEVQVDVWSAPHASYLLCTNKEPTCPEPEGWGDCPVQTVTISDLKHAFIYVNATHRDSNIHPSFQDQYIPIYQTNQVLVQIDLDDAEVTFDLVGNVPVVRWSSLLANAQSADLQIDYGRMQDPDLGAIFKIELEWM